MLSKPMSMLTTREGGKSPPPLESKKLKGRKEEPVEDLVILRSKESVCSSLDVAEKFGKNHFHILRDIEKLETGINGLENSQSTQSNLGLSEGLTAALNFEGSEEPVKMFFRSSYTDESGKRNKMYYINRDGLMLLVMGFTGKRALRKKLGYISAFNGMEERSKWI